MNVVVVYSTEQHQIAWIIAATLRAAVNVMDVPPHTAGTIFERNQANSPMMSGRTFANSRSNAAFFDDFDDFLIDALRWIGERLTTRSSRCLAASRGGQG